MKFKEMFAKRADQPQEEVNHHTSSFFLLPSSFLKPSSFFLLPSSFSLSPAFTIIELLVASLLLGMVMTILTMVFNQSSISWRTGMAGLVDMGKIRAGLAEVREEADNAFVSNDKLYRITGLWDKNGNLRNRACDAPSSTDENENKPEFLLARFGASGWANYRPSQYDLSSYTPSGSAGAAYTYTVNVKSAGPNKIYDDWDDIWSFPDDFE